MLHAYTAHVSTVLTTSSARIAMTFFVITTHSYRTICYHTLFLQQPALLLSEQESQKVILREWGTSKPWISWLCQEMPANGWLEVKAARIKTGTNSPMQ